MKRRKGPSAAVPPGQRVYAVGDIHGRLDLLELILAQIDKDDTQRGPTGTTLIFLGDLVDRGPDSCGVIERLIALRDTGAPVRFIQGNHDEVFLKAAAGDTKAMRFLTRFGGKETVLSYGVDEETYRACDFPGLARLFAKHVPEVHRTFVNGFECSITIGDYLFVHAGIRPGVPLDAQSPSDLKWIRDEFLDSQDQHEKIVVHGHSISDEVDNRTNRIGIDTGAFASGRLTAIGLEGTERWFLCAEGSPDNKWGKLAD